MRHFIFELKNKVADCVRRRPMVAGACLLVLATLVLLGAFRPTRSIALSVVGLTGYYLLCLALLWRTPAHEAWRGLRMWAKGAMIGLGVAFSLFSVWYLLQYDFIPIWDWFTYWYKTLQFNEHLSVVPMGTVLDALNSANASDYGDMQCWVMSLPVRFFPSWKGTVLSEIVLIAVPAAAVLSLAGVGYVRSGMGDEAEPTRFSVAAIVSFVVCLLCPILLRPALVGYLDEVAGLLYLCTIVATHDRRLVRSIWKPIVLGLSLVTVMVMRRWLIYGVIALVVSALLRWGLHLVKTPRDERMVEFGRVARTLLLVAASALVPLVTFFRPFFLHALLGNYSEAYQGYAVIGSLGDRLSDVVLHYGWIWIVLGLLSFVTSVFLLWRKTRGSERAAVRAIECLSIPVCLCVGALLAMLVFWRTQDFTTQHWLFFTYPFVLSLSLVAGGAVMLVSRSVYRLYSALVCVLAVLSCVNGLGVLGDALSAVHPLIGCVSCSPIVQPDVAVRRDFASYLDQAVADGDDVFFAASSERINASLPLSVAAPERLSVPFACLSSDVDLRDGFNVGFLDSEWVVTANPVQTALEPSFTQVSVILNELVQEPDSYLGRHFALDRDFVCPDGMVISLYRKTSELERSDVEALRNRFGEIYPQKHDLFDDRFDAYLREMG